MAKPTPLRVDFKDAGAKPVTVDRVVLEIGGAKTELKKSPFEFSLSAAGTGTLLFEKAKHHTYTFLVEVVDGGSEFTLKFHKDGIDKPRMGHLAKVMAVGAGGASIGVNSLTFTIEECKEVLLVTGYDYSGGSKYRAFATTRMHDLAKAGTIDDSTVITLMEFETGKKTRWVRGRGKERVKSHMWSSGWCRMTDELVGTAAPVPVRGGGDPGTGSISMPHVHEHIVSIGKARKGTLIEYSIFSHSTAKGPIMFNTYEGPDFAPGGARAAERDPDDHDGRFWKDFTAVNLPDVADFKAAFSIDPLVKIWGCLAITAWRRMLNAARRAKNDTDKLGVSAANRTSIFTAAKVYPDTRPGILEFFREEAFKATYMFFMSKTIGHPVWGGPPGTGSLILSSGKWVWHYVPEYEFKMSGGKRVKVRKYYYNELHYMEKELGWTFSPDWYMKYS